MPSKQTRAELQAELRRYRDGLAVGRLKGAAVQRLGAALRQNLIERSVGDLLTNPETARWRTDELVDFVFSRQADIGLRPRYSRSSLDRRVRRALRKLRSANSCQSDHKTRKALAA